MLPHITRPKRLVLSTRFPLTVRPIIRRIKTNGSSFRQLRHRVVLPFDLMIKIRLFRNIIRCFNRLLRTIQRLYGLCRPLITTFNVLIRGRKDDEMVCCLYANLNAYPNGSSFHIVRGRFFTRHISGILNASNSSRLVKILQYRLRHVSGRVSPRANEDKSCRNMIFIRLRLLRTRNAQVLLTCVFGQSRLMRSAMIGRRRRNEINEIILHTRMTFKNIVDLCVVRLTTASRIFMLLTMKDRNGTTIRRCLRIKPCLFRTLLSHLFRCVFSRCGRPKQCAKGITCVYVSNFTNGNLRFKLRILRRNYLLTKCTSGICR